MRLPATIVTLALAMAAVSSATMTPTERGFLIRSIEVDGSTRPYSVYVPRDWNPSKSWPVILFLHGAGERGSDGLRSTQIGVAAAIRHNPELVPAIAVFPQVPLDQNWLAPNDAIAMAALEHAIREFHGDRDRVYLAGLSMGGYGAYHLAMAHPDTFAAMVVVCGGILPQKTTTSVAQSPLSAGSEDPYAFTAHAIRHIPIRIFHGGADPVIPPEESRRLAADLEREGADVRYVEYEGVGHNAWDRAFGDADLWNWLFRQRRSHAASN